MARMSSSVSLASYCISAFTMACHAINRSTMDGESSTTYIDQNENENLRILALIYSLLISNPIDGPFDPNEASIHPTSIPGAFS